MRTIQVKPLICALVLSAAVACSPTTAPAPPSSTPVPATMLPTSTVLATLSPDWVTYSDATYGISFDYPAQWEPVVGYDRRYAGPDGFFQLGAISSAAASIDEVAEDDAHHKLMPYGSEPTIQAVQVAGQDARLILPSADQPQIMGRQASVIVRLPARVEISGQQYDYLILWVDEDHINHILQTVRLSPPVAQATPALMPSYAADAVQSLLSILAMQFRTGADHIDLIQWEYVVWPDGCLGVSMRRVCTQATVPGFRVNVRVEGEDYEYRTDLEGTRFFLAEGPAHGIESPALIFESSEDCQALLLAADGAAAVGPCDAPLTPVHLPPGTTRQQQWSDWLTRFAGFETDTPSGKVVFVGSGTDSASPAWQRALAAWALLVQSELQTGRSGATWSTAATWRQEILGRPGYCRSLRVDAFGLGVASEILCKGGFAQIMGQGWLTNDEMESLDRLLYSKAPVEVTDAALYGLGTEEASESDLQELRIWAEAVYERLSQS